MELQSNSEFLGKKIVITGASSGIGRSCALYFLNSGAKVVLCGRDMESLKKIGEGFPDQAAVICLDLIEDLQIFDFKSSAIEFLGKIDIFINCAGVMFDGDLEKTFPQDYDYTLDVNVRSIFAMFLHFRKFFNKGCSIVNVSCLYGTKPFPGMLSYCMSKAGLEMLTKFSAAEFAEFGIRVNAVTSSPVDTNCQRYAGVSEKEYSDFKDRVTKTIPLNKMALPDDVAKAIIFLASARSSKVTGQIIKVDGGRSLTTGGFVPWKGTRNMNARFEPDGVNPSYKMKEMWNGLTGKNKKEPVYPQTEDEIDNLLNESNWSTRLTEAHAKVLAPYKNIDQNDEYLDEHFVKFRV
jgi:NAD(P)-dependent dehydrogenase (short-subunit alcohol dehydrogenase family)